ncbi:hypothetical protein [Tomitella biformata]|nr:hypothetical protein [Tomitella biformata]
MAKQRYIARDDNGRMALAHAQIAMLPQDWSGLRGSWGSLFRFMSAASA